MAFKVVVILKSRQEIDCRTLRRMYKILSFKNLLQQIRLTVSGLELATSMSKHTVA